MHYYLFLENSIHVNLENRARIAFLYRKKFFCMQKIFPPIKKQLIFCIKISCSRIFNVLYAFLFNYYTRKHLRHA